MLRAISRIYDLSKHLIGSKNTDEVKRPSAISKVKVTGKTIQIKLRKIN